MNIRTFFSIIICSAVIYGCSCRADDGSTEADLAAARAAGERDAAAVVEAAPNTYEREHAVLAIRARESAMRDAAFPDAADAYIEAAHAVLTENNIIE